MGQAPSCWEGIRRSFAPPNNARNTPTTPESEILLLDGNAAQCEMRRTQSTAPSTFKCRQARKPVGDSNASALEAGFLDFDPRLLHPGSPRESTTDIVDKIATVLYAHVDHRVFSSLEDDAYHIGHFSWGCFFCVKTRSKLNVTKEDIYERLKYLLTTLNLSTEICVITLIYIERLLATRKAQFTPANWEVILTTGVVLGTKVWDDIHPWNIDFELALASSSRFPGPFTASSIYKMESLFLKHIDFGVHVHADVYAHYYFSLTGGGDPTEMLEKIEEELNVSKYAPESPFRGSSRMAGPVYTLDLCLSPVMCIAPTHSSDYTHLQRLNPRNPFALFGLPSATPAGMGRLDPRNPYVGTFQHAKPSKKPSGSFVSGDMSCLCNLQGKCHICVRRSKIAYVIKEESSLKYNKSWASFATTIPESTSAYDGANSPLPDERSPLQGEDTVSTKTLTGVTGKYLAKELKQMRCQQRVPSVKVVNPVSFPSVSPLSLADLFPAV
eukprot:GEMP01010692.1.p1 GENE.GEMP01010692.1~~GEMP01010692.1.p1  ORF type:complete len:498 (+),score=44.05 GEMP01010692.1:43-1536(+)